MWLWNMLHDYRGDFMWSSVAALVSLIAAVLSIVGVRKNSKTQKDIAKQQIDASLKAKARIEWIEKVRENASNLITVLLTLQKEEKDFNLIWENGEKYSEILKLYFSSKTNKGVGGEIYITNNVLFVSEVAKEALFNRESNENKNQYIIEYITCMMKMNRDDHYNNTKKNLVAFKKKEKEIDKELFEIGKIEYEHETIEFKDGTVEEVNNPITVNPKNENSERYIDIEAELDRVEKLIETFNKKLELFENSVAEFSSIISLYLKLEWDRAKEGK